MFTLQHVHFPPLRAPLKHANKIKQTEANSLLFNHLLLCPFQLPLLLIISAPSSKISLISLRHRHQPTDQFLVIHGLLEVLLISGFRVMADSKNTV